MEKRTFLLLFVFVVLLGASCGGEEATQLPPTPTPIPTIDPYGAVEHLVEPGDPVYFPEQSAYDAVAAAQGESTAKQMWADLFATVESVSSTVYHRHADLSFAGGGG